MLNTDKMIEVTAEVLAITYENRLTEREVALVFASLLLAACPDDETAHGVIELIGVAGEAVQTDETLH